MNPNQEWGRYMKPASKKHAVSSKARPRKITPREIDEYDEPPYDDNEGPRNYRYGDGASILEHTRLKIVKPRNAKQEEYMATLKTKEIVFCIGPAGTGKTLLAVQQALIMLKSKEIKKIIITRPLVTAEEELGFLPGDIREKMNPIMLPLYDSVDEIMGFPGAAQKLLDNFELEIAPVSYLRGRTLKSCAVVADECQNLTVSQMKMLVSRIGENSKMFISGDIEQIDLPTGKMSGLKFIIECVKYHASFGFCEFSRENVVRHPLIGTLLSMFDSLDTSKERFTKVNKVKD